MKCHRPRRIPTQVKFERRERVLRRLHNELALVGHNKSDIIRTCFEC
jgi:hypothetical protein